MKSTHTSYERERYKHFALNSSDNEDYSAEASQIAVMIKNDPGINIVKNKTRRTKMIDVVIKTSSSEQEVTSVKC